jgi:DNA invertase Pin-like site-specific DNA recombinase
MKKIGYARVSTEEQTLALQLDALRAAGCDSVHRDQLSGAAGDVLHVWKLDRLGRSMVELVGIVEDLRRRGVGLKVLTGEGAAIDTTRPEGRLIFGVFAAFAEFERELIRERTRAGMNAARRRGKRIGRPRALSPEQVDMARRLIAENTGKRTVARMMGVDPATLWRALGGKDYLPR